MKGFRQQDHPRDASMSRCQSGGAASRNEPEPLGEVAYAILFPVSLVGIHDRSGCRCIVSERIGGTVRRAVGPAE